jgi:hypothetical protein
MLGVVLALTCVTGCTGLKPATSGATPLRAPVVASPAESANDSVTPTPAAQQPSAMPPSHPTPAPAPAAAVERPAAAATTSKEVKNDGPASEKAKRLNSDQSLSAPVAATPPAAKQAPIARVPRKPVDGMTETPQAPPTLDLASLEERLRDTRAIGVFTKLSLKNQVDDLLGQFRAYHGKQSQIQLTELRQRYNLLLIKVLTLLQDSDAPLAAAISSSREAIWAILTDPEKFAKIQS